MINFAASKQSKKRKEKKMKKLLFMFALLLSGMSASAQAKIEFDKLTHDFGKFTDTTVKCTFTYTNVGDQPLVIHQAIASCGCTVPTYTKEPVKPGEKGTIEVTYHGKFFGHFKKPIVIRTNGAEDVVRLYIEGTMEDPNQK